MLKIRKLQNSPNYEAVVAWVGPFGDKNSDGVSRVVFDEERVEKFLAERQTTRERVIDTYDSHVHPSGYLSKMSEERYVKTTKGTICIPSADQLTRTRVLNSYMVEIDKRF